MSEVMITLDFEVKYNCAPAARSKHITNSYLEARIEEHTILNSLLQNHDGICRRQ